jgi:hypothetical protein
MGLTPAIKAELSLSPANLKKLLWIMPNREATNPFDHGSREVATLGCRPAVVRTSVVFSQASRSCIFSGAIGNSEY